MNHWAFFFQLFHCLFAMNKRANVCLCSCETVSRFVSGFWYISCWSGIDLIDKWLSLQSFCVWTDLMSMPSFRLQTRVQSGHWMIFPFDESHLLLNLNRLCFRLSIEHFQCELSKICANAPQTEIRKPEVDIKTNYKSNVTTLRSSTISECPNHFELPNWVRFAWVWCCFRFGLRSVNCCICVWTLWHYLLVFYLDYYCFYHLFS